MYAATSYFARSYFGGIWPSFAGLTIRPVGIAQSVEFGLPVFQFELNILPLGIDQYSEFGTPLFGLELLPSGIAQNIEFGLPGLNLEVSVVGIVQDTEFGTPRIQLEILATGIDQYSQFGTPGIQVEVRPTGFDQAATFGIPEIQVEVLEGEIRPGSIYQLVEFGIPSIELEYIAPIVPIEIAIKFVPGEELTRINTRPTIAPAQFKSLIAKSEQILASSLGGNEMENVVKVVIKQDETGQIISAEPISIGGIPVAATTRLDLLQDVDPSTEVEGGVPRYDAETDKYVVEKLDFADITGTIPVEAEDIDGGTF